MKLICVPYAGGTTEIFSDFTSHFSEAVQVIALDYAGHGKRRKEPYYEHFNDMVCDMASEINKITENGESIALFGYSMGSVVVYEILAQKLLHAKAKYVMLASHEAPSEEWDSKKFSEESEEDFFLEIQKMGGFVGVDTSILQNRFFRRLHFDPLYADYLLIGDYKMSSAVKLPVEATFYYSKNDMTKEQAEVWRDFFEGELEIIEIGKNHFFINEHAKEMAEHAQHRIV